MPTKRILWADDEIDMLKPHVMALQAQGCDVVTVTNGDDALAEFDAHEFDLVLLDENMPGKSGIDVLRLMKQKRGFVPMVMVTKNEKADTMDSALGAQVDDFLVKPVNISQLLACVSKVFRQKELVEQSRRTEFLSNYQTMTTQMSECETFKDWAGLYHRLVDWELKLPEEFVPMLMQLKADANAQFSKYVMRNYVSWFSGQAGEVPLFSHRILSEVVKPAIVAGEKVALVVIDNFRMDQWEVLRPILEEDFVIKAQDYCSILPTSTQYSRNAIFSGLLPADIKKMYPDYWVDSVDDEDSRNNNERELLDDYFKRQRMTVENSYYKVGSNQSGEEYISGFAGGRRHRGYKNNQLNALVFSFVDMLSHARTSSHTLQDLIPNDAAYRSVTRSWFLHGIMHRILLLLKENGFKVILTTDHGSIRVGEPVDISGPRDINHNLRFKFGKSLGYDPKRLFEINGMKDLAAVGLPASNITSQYVFAIKEDYFVYKNNRSEYVEKFSDSFQHGGISMEEMILPLVTLTPRR